MAIRRTNKPWFGPKRVTGWGWSPVSWQGWAVSGVFLVLVAVSLIAWPGAAGSLVVVGLVVVLVLVALLTGDPPGGPGSG